MQAGHEQQLVIVDSVSFADSTVCDYCHKDLRTPSLLARHVTVHTKEKRYMCVCGRGYTRPDRYRKHLELCDQATAEKMAMNAARKSWA